MPDMRFLPVDYHSEVARELVDFFHSFYRFGAASNVFDLSDPQYAQFLHNVLFGSLAVGAVVFLALCVIVARRCFLHIRSAYARRQRLESNTTELAVVLLMTFIAVSALSGLLGEAQVDYSVGVVHHAMTNASERFGDAHALAANGVLASDAVRTRADNLVVSFNESELPTEAFKLSVEALRLLHSSKELVNATDAQLPNDYGDMVTQWRVSYFMLKSATNAAILSVALSSFLLISSIGWSMVTPLRLSILILLSVIPVSHTLIGVYLSSTIMTSDFCAAPGNATATLLRPNAAVTYFLECRANASSPLLAPAASVFEDAKRVGALQQQLEVFAGKHPDVGVRMKSDFLDPIGDQLESIDTFLAAYNKTQACNATARSYEHAVGAFCEYGMLGFFSMWVHQILLCLFLFVGVVASVLAYERVHIREIRTNVQYQLLSSYEDDNMEHVYLSAD
ncbi:hypothetical protein PybrP1_006356 [[Pythium] brassicae (nom. inval.)]|nr:hypothetical protein PybrP1_006356 [[Pythium] brassicae (nom. inval.)]